jgi:chromosome partitioning protein
LSPDIADATILYRNFIYLLLRPAYFAMTSLHVINIDGLGRCLADGLVRLRDERGYRVLVVDCDSQTTTTSLFGFNPHFNITREQTLYPYLSIDPTQTDLLYAVQKTPWPNVDLIPSNLELFDVEYELAASGADGGSVLASRFRKLKKGLQDLARNYDIVLLDQPPALGTISLAVMQAANALLVPMAATKPDF